MQPDVGPFLQVNLKKSSDTLHAEYKRQQEQHARDEAALQAYHQREVLLVRYSLI